MFKIFEFDKVNDKILVAVDKLKCFIPRRYEHASQYVVGEHVNVLGIFDMLVNDTEKRGLHIPAMIPAMPSEISSENYEGESYITLIFFKGDVFSTTHILLQNPFLGYYMWNEFLALGHLPSSITYDHVINLFDNMRRFTGKGIPTNHAVLEMIYSHMFRLKDDMTKQIRLTDRTAPYKMINLHDVAYGATTTHSRIFGSYSTAGYNSAMLNTQTKNNDLEDVFRQ